MGDEHIVIKNKVDAGGVTGPIWFMGWLFTIGYLHLHVLKAAYALVIWPYYLGAALKH